MLVSIVDIIYFSSYDIIFYLSRECLCIYSIIISGLEIVSNFVPKLESHADNLGAHFRRSKLETVFHATAGQHTS